VDSIWGLFTFDARGPLGQGWLWGKGAEVEAGMLPLAGADVQPARAARADFLYIRSYALFVLSRWRGGCRHCGRVDYSLCRVSVRHNAIAIDHPMLANHMRCSNAAHSRALPEQTPRLWAVVWVRTPTRATNHQAVGGSVWESNPPVPVEPRRRRI
jgi:hypothetical protein